METIQTLDPRAFRGLICSVGVLPTSFIESMSYYEMIAWLVNYIKVNVIPTVNGHASAIEEIQNWIETLDLQDYVNEKLEDMAESGQLAEIIAEFLNSQCVFAFDTINDMKATEAMGVGSIARVLGNTNPLTGDGAFYRVRAILNTDTIDGVNKVALTNANNLIAVRITDAAVNAVNARIDNLSKRKYVFIGDSYGDGYTPDGVVTSWITNVVTNLGLSAGDYISSHHGGDGFATPANSSFLNQLNALSSDNAVTDVVVGGGYNDNPYTLAEVKLGITTFYTACKTKFPNAKLHILPIGWTKNASAKTNLVTTYKAYHEAALTLDDAVCVDNMSFILHEYFDDFASDGIHPNSTGQTRLGDYIAKYLRDGTIDVQIIRTNVFGLTPVNSGTLSGTWSGFQSLHNGISTATADGSGTINWTSGNEVTISGKALTQLATINAGLFVGTNKESVSCSTLCVCQTTDNKYHSLNLTLIIKEGKLYCRANLINSAGSNYDSLEVKMIQVNTFNMTVNSLLA